MDSSHASADSSLTTVRSQFEGSEDCEPLRSRRVDELFVRETERPMIAWLLRTHRAVAVPHPVFPSVLVI